MILLAIALVAVFTAGIYIGMVNAPQETNKYTLKPYRGVGNGVLKHGTILKEEYRGPESIAGNLDIYGIWILEEK